MWLLVLLLCPSGAIGAAIDLSPVYSPRELAGAVDAELIENTVGALAAMGSRVPGQPGNRWAAEWVQDALEGIGLDDVTAEPFDVVVPLPDGLAEEQRASGRPWNRTGAKLELSDGQTLTLHPLWPNLVRTCRTPPDGVTGHIIDAGYGELSVYNGRDPKGSIVLLEFNSGRAWYDARMLGASAILFAEPDLTLRREAEEKFSELPINVPRFYVRGQDLADLRAALRRDAELTGTVTCDVSLRTVETWNITARLPGRHSPGGAVDSEALAKQTVVLTAYYDSISVVPDIAPGADSACGIAALLEIARLLKQYPPERDVIFLATSAHFEAMKGIREFVVSRAPAEGEDPAFRALLALDLSSHGRGIGTFWKGRFYHITEAHTYKFSDLGMACGSLGETMAPHVGLDPEDPSQAALTLLDTVNTGAERHWSTFLPLPLCMEGEPATLSGYCGLTFASLEDARPYLDTPFDTVLDADGCERVDLGNLTRQTGDRRRLRVREEHLLPAAGPRAGRLRSMAQATEGRGRSAACLHRRGRRGEQVPLRRHAQQVASGRRPRAWRLPLR